jgi:hypothetical protein
VFDLLGQNFNLRGHCVPANPGGTRAEGCLIVVHKQLPCIFAPGIGGRTAAAAQEWVPWVRREWFYNGLSAVLAVEGGSTGIGDQHPSALIVVRAATGLAVEIYLLS